MTESIDHRRQPCVVLQENGIPSALWFEDALKAYGVPTMLFQLYLLVLDITIAAKTLEEHGWKPVLQQHGRIGRAILDLDRYPQRRLIHEHPNLPDLPACESTVVLLPAAEWNLDIEKKALVAFLPSLEDLLDALIKRVLDGVEEALQGYLNMMLAYLYGHAPELRERAFAERLIYEHRQYHYDVRSGMSTGTLLFVAHQRKVREALRHGTASLQECSASRDNEDLFNNAVQARLLASMPPPPPISQADLDDSTA